MSLLSRLFSKSCDDCLRKGDRLFEAERYFEARSRYEEGLRIHLTRGKGVEADATSSLCREKIARANRELARRNLEEAGHALASSDPDKAREHLDLALSLTDDAALRQACLSLLAGPAARLDEPPHPPGPPPAGCGSCGGTRSIPSPPRTDEPQLSRHDHYDLLIRQLPAEMYRRYALLGERFVDMYLAACCDDHENALNMLEAWYKGEDQDIYWYEKGMLLHRLGDEARAEACLRTSIECDAANPLPCLSLALALCHGGRLGEAMERLDAMIDGGMLVEQARMLRGDVSALSGDVDAALSCYGALLSTPVARPATEKAHELLVRTGRDREAAALYARYLRGCGH